MASTHASKYAFITDAQFELLVANGLQAIEQEDFDPLPVVKLFTPDAGATWLLTSIEPDDPDVAHNTACAILARASRNSVPCA